MDLENVYWFESIKICITILPFFLHIVTYEVSTETKLRCKGDILFHLLETKLLL